MGTWKEYGHLKPLTMMKIKIKKIVKLSRIYESARAEFDEMKKHRDLDTDFFNDEELDYYVMVIIRSHIDDWLVINDMNTK